MMLGPQTADVIFYLPTPPITPTNWQATHPDAVAQLMALNGNHWRKIFTIMAKICSVEPDITLNNGAAWKAIRANLFCDSTQANTLLTQPSLGRRLSCQIQIVEPNTAPLHLCTQQWHIVCGKETQQRLGIDTQAGHAVAQTNKIRRQQTCLLTPYLDYRQYSNALIETTRQIIANAGISHD
ncbi:hypothetical protein K8B83_10895 [Shewanella inventionis]|uniref:Uncharacterized protein n=1 Tax=Shewanella inventionis TaxID=1738770 RepID=A0ABQ1IVR3_9GAMM|nr:hypothetical protein [Shewanella inventionis]MCL1156793.1 hypothetical protein [Shewanella inventionis]UAL41438.1 hypothetical protein K8B83_10895 [Shewanella inventionis]GGB51673.1 hypothetical protein GCM10011607_10170 [Shewanella inventionis]